MSEQFTIGIGTVGFGMWWSYDSGEKWRHIYKHVNPESSVRAVCLDPSDHQRVLCAADRTGLFQSTDGGYRWFPLPSPITNSEIWSLAIDPSDPNRIFVGNRPGVWRSNDAGETWEELDMGLDPNCPIGISRTTNVVFDPRDPRRIWAGVEVDGVYRSDDGGDTWSHLGDVGPSPFHNDIHGLAVRPRDGEGGDAELMLGTPFGLGTSVDDGATWSWRSFGGFPKGSGNEYAYCRGVFVKPGEPDTVLVGCGDFIPGAMGGIEVSHDGGQTFTRAKLPVQANSTVYWMAMHPDVPDVVAACSIYGQIFVSRDSGDSWSKLDREFGEIRSIVIHPN
jgi:photosystem II stability/assembly factor-like uncharacterized protein